MNFKQLLPALFLVLFGFYAQAQESHGGTPPSFVKIVELGGNVPAVEMPKVDVDALMAEDDLNTDKLQPFRFGFNHFINVNPENSGVWTKLKNGEKVWRTGIKCPGAVTVNITFDKFIIPEGAQLFVYNKDRSYILGSFTAKNVQDDGMFGVDLLPGEEVIVEYLEPANAAFNGKLNIFRITHGYRDMFKIAKSFGDAGNCHNNVVCPVGVPWADQIRSVAVIVVGGNESCTGALINNTANNGTPYFLTANHCGTNGVNTWVFRFNWNSPTCTPSANGPTNQSVTGSSVKAQAAASDFTLLQLNSTPPANYNVYYAGWNRSNIPPTSGAGIHHPSGDVKKISFSTTAFDSSAWSGSIKNHWLVQWSNGVTEPGSSGSPMFDQNKRIVGQLHGGPSYCGAPNNSLNDDYGKIFYSWDKNGANANQRLKPWLDPSNTGSVTIDGYDPNQVALPALEAAASNLVLPSNASTCLATYTPTFTVTNGGTTTINTMSITWTLDGGSPQTYTWNGTLASLGTAVVTMPQITFGTGAHTYAIAIVTVNGSADSDNSNNALTGNFTAIQGITYTISGTTDNYGNETAFYILSLAGDTAFVSDTGSIAPNTPYSFDVCLAPGCYKFIVTDAFGDGMCCNFGDGNYVLTNDADVVIAAGGQFGSSVTTYFCTTTPANNSALLDIIAPEGSYCNTNQVIPQVLIANQGSADLTTLTIKYKVDNGAIQTYPWSGTLAYNDSAIVNFPAITMTSGNHTFTVYTSGPNGSTDGITGNDTLVTTFSYAVGTPVTFTLTTDDYPNETAWTLAANPGGNVLYQSGNPSGYVGASTYNTTFCLPNGCYRFLITDSEGDGICCTYGDGAFALNGPQNEQIATGGQFTVSDTVDFCIPLTAVAENEAPIFKVYPNPAVGELFILLGNSVKENLIVELINAQGQVVETTSIQNAPLAKISVSNHAAGIYLVRIYGQKTKPSIKTVIIKN